MHTPTLLHKKSTNYKGGTISDREFEAGSEACEARSTLLRQQIQIWRVVAVGCIARVVAARVHVMVIS